MSVFSAYGQAGVLPKVNLSNVYHMHASQLMKSINPNNPHQHIWTTNNGWIGVTSFEENTSNLASASFGSFFSTLKSIGHNLVKALPTVINVGMKVIPLIAAATTAEDLDSEVGSVSVPVPENSFHVTFTPSLDMGAEFGPLTLLVTPTSVSPVADGTRKAPMSQAEQNFLHALGELGSGALRQITLLAGQSPDTFGRTASQAMALVMPNILSTALSPTSAADAAANAV